MVQEIKKKIDTGHANLQTFINTIFESYTVNLTLWHHLCLKEFEAN